MSDPRTDPRTYPDPPVQLPMPDLLEPVPVEGCDVCAALARQRAEARVGRDMSCVSDSNVELRRHPHPHRTPTRRPAK
ncbi:hypothetical protein [Streptomyces sp. NPDC048442]|uniref:hypothetical protein n=1 Tax=Streptomyces sp. NPDC048442 TaxID=3154823 RepID=UPI003441AB8A